MAADHGMVGQDGRVTEIRCSWALTPGPMQDYHDEEWGVVPASADPVGRERAYFERITLEAFQSGLSWSTILAKRPGFRRAFAGFDPEQVASYDDADQARLMADASIVRNRAKIAAAVTNARATLALREDGGLEAFVLGFAPELPPAYTQTTSPESVALAKALKRRGFAFVGPTTAYAAMQALGVFDPHAPECFRHAPK
jgi:DNA-3-methyladenine glycosylase I